MDFYDENDLATSMSYEDVAPELDEFDSLPPSAKTGVEYLSNVDYSLNSPLIEDEIQEFLKYYNGLSYRQSWNLKVWKARIAVLDKLKCQLDTFIRPSEFHNWFGRKNLTNNSNLSLIKDLMDLSQQDSDITYPVVAAFFRGWIDKNVDNPDKTRCHPHIMKWGAYFLDFHIVTLFLNAIDGNEITELLKISGTKRVSPDYPDQIIYRSHNFGRILINNGFVFFLDEKIIMDRNTLLMCKDTYVARFQTLISMINRTDDMFDSSEWETLNQIYLLGDKCLRTVGNQAYDALKLIEPISSLRMADLAHEYRHYIPEFPEFSRHVRQSVAAMKDAGIPLGPIFDLIHQQNNPNLVLTVFGSFRHWGHPFVKYLDGLKSLSDQVHMPKKIDKKYANALASDLAYLVLSSKFNETKQWYVDKTKVHGDHIFHSHITTGTWPTPKQVQDFGDNWHRLPLVRCYEIPDVIDPSIIYADKSHSMNRTDILSHIKNHPNIPIPSKKVLQTFINSPATNWKEFLTEINDNGLSSEDLVIGLKAKERELKIKGRFFSLMSWRLREYFVVTEYLIKTHFVPLFKGLTMADDLNTVVKKLMDNSNGQGLDTYDNICIANHIDYEKWNNHQRHEANGPVFRVMGQFLGYPNLILRTHEFFQNSFVYYNGRPDLMTVIGNRVENKHDALVCWNGQAGGLEGLRQKGWSVTNLLVIRREAKLHNTKVKSLAQGDNQVVCTQYRIQPHRNEDELKTSLLRIVNNNQKIMSSIEEGTKKLGLIINKDETLQSADFLIYGKVPIYRGNIMGIESKRWARVTCVTNDQLPTLANTMSTINSNALTVAHFATSPINAIVHYNFLGNFARNLLELHNPAIRSSPQKILKHPEVLSTREFKAAVLYLDPCLGGGCGMSLTRFLIRAFPDPLTESLSFWKLIGDHGPLWVREMAGKVGNPRLGTPNLLSFRKLLEDPLSVNIPGGMNPLTVIKDEIRNNLISNSHTVKNEIIRSSIEYLSEEEDRLIEYMRSITPLFPRFLSEYISGTYIGIVRNLVGLFQNSKTIRNVFSRRLDKKIKLIIMKSEVRTLETLGSFHSPIISIPLWECSSTQADRLRHNSWGMRVYGATVPHPIELLHSTINQKKACPGCVLNPPSSYYISTLVPQGLGLYRQKRGPYKAYLGSRTSESTSLLQPWEKETKVPLIRRATRLRSAIGWFVDPESSLADSILQNLDALTGETWSNQVEGFKRTGSALHRFSCTRQSSAGYAAQSPSKLTWMCSTTDTLSTLNSVNYDFMHQSLLIYAQATISEIMDGISEQGYFHNHISCLGCLREIEEITLTTPMSYVHRDMSLSLSKWKPEGTPWAELKSVHNLPLGDWSRLKPEHQSYHVGRASGFLYGDLRLSSNSHSEDTSIFPLSIQRKVVPRDYLLGILNGLIRASSLHCISRKSVSDLKRPKAALLGIGLHLIDEVSIHPGLVTLWRSSNFERLFHSVPHKIPSSYPLSNSDLSLLGRNYIRTLYFQQYIQNTYEKDVDERIWIFADINDPTLVGLYVLSEAVTKTLYSNKLTTKEKEAIRSYKDQVVTFKDPRQLNSIPKTTSQNVFRVDQEVRHACKEIEQRSDKNEWPNHCWKTEATVNAYKVTVPFQIDTNKPSPHSLKPQRIQNPLISGMRLFHFATGSHYKLRSILSKFRIPYHDVIVAGDGSGGIGAAILRLSPTTRLIFNSLLTLDKVDLRGTAPSPPSALISLGSMGERCVNLRNVWENPSDLTEDGTWIYFYSLKKDYSLEIDLMVIDAEIPETSQVALLEEKIETHIFPLLSKKGTLIYKTYMDRLLGHELQTLRILGCLFKRVELGYTEITSSQSSEVYIICSFKKTNTDKLIPDLELLEEEIKNWPCFLSEIEDFPRALGLRTYDMMKGVPKELRLNKAIEFSGFLASLNVETGVAAILSELLDLSGKEHPYESAFCLLIVSLNSILNFTGLYNNNPKPPSDSSVYNVAVIICGFLNWMSLSTESVELHMISQIYIRGAFSFSWKNQRFKITRKKSTEIKYNRKYSFLGQYELTKNFHIDSHMARVGQWTRILVIYFGYPPYYLDIKVLETFLKSFNEKLTSKLVQSRTDLFDLLEGKTPKLIKTSDYPAPVLHEDDQEGAYVS